MHTATSLKSSMFSLEMDGATVARDAIFAARKYERIGIVVTSPLGGLGASFLVQLGITAYYDAPGADRQANPHYPEIYYFHLGGSFGDYSMMDAWPRRKQIFVSDGAAALAAINSHAITHLLLPDESRREEMHGFAEPNSAYDRLERCFLYDPSGRTEGGSIAVRAVDASVHDDIRAMMHPRQAMDRLLADYQPPADPMESDDNEQWIAFAKGHLADVSENDENLAEQRRAALAESGGALETYREITANDAVRRLGRVRPE